jgi:serine/threonine protein kinase
MLLPASVTELFRIDGELGRSARGGMYRALWLAGDQTVALKVLKRDQLPEGFLHAFEKDATALAQLRSTGVQRPVTWGITDDAAYVAYPFLEGRDLQSLAAAGPVGTSFLRRIGLDLAGALEELHRAGLTHQALKPANAIVSAAGQTVATDPALGAAFLPVGEGAMDQALAAQRQRTPGQPAVDVYGLGLILYALLVGQAPFTTAGSDPVPPLKLRPEADPLLVDLVMRCLVQEPEVRPGMPAVRQMLSRLKATSAPIRTAQDSARVWMSPSGPKTEKRLARRETTRRSGWPIVAAVVALGLLILLRRWFSSPYRPVPDPPATSSLSRQ